MSYIFIKNWSKILLAKPGNVDADFKRLFTRAENYSFDRCDIVVVATET
jgi:hypothetical protein